VALYPLLRPFAFALDAERAHRATIGALKLLPAGRPAAPDPILSVQVAGLDFPNPVGLAAGFDKDAEVFRQMLGFGFGFVEVGTLTPLPQSGNPKPRLFRLAEDRAAINRLGFNNDGQSAALTRLRAHRRRGLVGVNIGANKDSADRIADYSAGIAAMTGVADYLTVNISSPNTPGLRTLQTKAALEELLGRLADARQALAGNVPVFLKVAPDLEDGEVETIAATTATHGLDGIIVSNTTVSRPDLASAHRGETGGLSGKPLLDLSTLALRRFRAAAPDGFTLIGAGGIASGSDAYAKIRAGACAVQLYSGLVFEGPGLIRRIKRDLAARLKSDGFTTVTEAIGA